MFTEAFDLLLWCTKHKSGPKGGTEFTPFMDVLITNAPTISSCLERCLLPKYQQCVTALSSSKPPSFPSSLPLALLSHENPFVQESNFLRKTDKRMQQARSAALSEKQEWAISSQCASSTIDKDLEYAMLEQESGLRPPLWYGLGTRWERNAIVHCDEISEAELLQDAEASPFEKSFVAGSLPSLPTRPSPAREEEEFAQLTVDNMDDVHYEPEYFTWLSDSRASFLRNGICDLHKRGLSLAHLKVVEFGSVCSSVLRKLALLQPSTEEMSAVQTVTTVGAVGEYVLIWCNRSSLTAQLNAEIARADLSQQVREITYELDVVDACIHTLRFSRAASVLFTTATALLRSYALLSPDEDTANRFSHFQLEHLGELCHTPYQDKAGPSLTLTHYLVQYLQQEKQQPDNVLEQLLEQASVINTRLLLWRVEHFADHLSKFDLLLSNNESETLGNGSSKGSWNRISVHELRKRCGQLEARLMSTTSAIMSLKEFFAYRVSSFRTVADSDEGGLGERVLFSVFREFLSSVRRARLDILALNQVAVHSVHHSALLPEEKNATQDAAVADPPVSTMKVSKKRNKPQPQMRSPAQEQSRRFWRNSGQKVSGLMED